MDAGGIDLAILDGEAVPAGGMGIAKQLKDEIYRCPPILVLIGRPQDAWLATWSRAEAAVPHPIDPVRLAEAVTALLRPRVPATTSHLTAVPPRWREVLGALVQRQDLTGEQTAWAMGEILAGAATPAQIAGFAVALRAKGETIDEVTGLLDAMYAVATPLTIPGRAARRRRHRRRPLDERQHLHDGRDRGGGRRARGWSSTATGRRPSQAGSADVLEALGIRLDLPPDRVAAAGRAGRHHLLLLRGVPPGDAARRRAAARAGHRDDVQHPRPAGQPGASPPPRRSAAPTRGWRR